MKKLLILILLCVFAASAFSYEELLLEATIKYSDGKIKWQDIIDAVDDGGLLIPIFQVAPALDLDVSFDRVNDIFSVTWQENTLPFSSTGYDNLPLLLDKMPVELAGDYYVHMEFFQSLMGITYLYDPLKMSLVIVLETPSPVVEQVESEELELEKTPVVVYEEPLSVLRPSSIEYQLEKTYRRGSSQTKGQFYLHFRSGLAEISIGAALDNNKLKNPYFLLTYENNNMLFKLGHTSFTSSTRLGNVSLFGLQFISPYPVISRNYPLAQIEIQGKKGDTAVIFVNNTPAKKVELKSNNPETVLVALKPYRYQVITVENAKILSKKISYNGVSNLNRGESQFNLYAGIFGKRQFEHLGELAELSYSRGLTDNIDFNLGFVWQRLGTVLEKPLLRSARQFELFSGVSLASNVYLVGKSVGGDASLITTFRTGYLELGYFNNPRDVLAYYQKPTGEGASLFLEKDLWSNLRLQGSAGVTFKTDTTPLLRYYKGSASLSFNKPLSRFSLSYGESENYLAQLEEVLRTKTLTAGMSLAFSRLSLSTKFSDQSFKLESLSWKQRQLQGKVTANLWKRLYLSSEAFVLEQEGALSGAGELQLGLSLPRSVNLNGAFDIQGKLRPDEELENMTASLALSFYLLGPHWEYKVQKNEGKRGDYTEYSCKVSLGNKDTQFWLSAALRQTAQKSLESTFKGYFGHTFASGLTLGLKYEKLPSSPLTGEQEHVASITISQGISFSAKGYLGHKYTGENLATTLAGTVFLDLNGNGLQDEEEPGVPNIEMRIGSKTATTNQDGFFLFSDLSPQITMFGFNPDKLTTDYVAPLLEMPVRIRTGDNIVLDMPLTMNGVLKGRVFIDTNLDGIYNDQDILLDWVQIKVLESEKQAFTNKNGNYYVEALPLGSFTVVVEPKSLPLGLKTPDPVRIHITPDALDVIVDFPLVY
ncbi:MAG TPA: hypothetical protein PKX45_04300 [Bacillota bacterium]|nr:hypothetical protein [Bacillota bacterium]